MGSDAESKLAAPKLFGRRKNDRPAEPEPAPEAVAEPVTEAVTEPEAVAGAEPEADASATVPEVEPRIESEPEPAAAPEAVAHPEPVAEPEPVPERRASRPARRPRAPRSLPAVTGVQGAAITGVVVGLFLVLATYGALHLCSTVRGASTCGGAAGFPLLLAIALLAVLGGGTLLRLFAITSPMGDSFLAVALVAVLTVLFLHAHYGAWWMLIVVPVLTGAAYLLAHWVSVTYIDPVEE